MRRDPVCGRRLSRRRIHAVVWYGGESFPMCSDRCESAFTESPARYVGLAYPTDDDMKMVLSSTAALRISIDELPGRSPSRSYATAETRPVAQRLSPIRVHVSP